MPNHIWKIPKLLEIKPRWFTVLLQANLLCLPLKTVIVFRVGWSLLPVSRLSMLCLSSPARPRNLRNTWGTPHIEQGTGGYRKFGTEQRNRVHRSNFSTWNIEFRQECGEHVVYFVKRKNSYLMAADVEYEILFMDDLPDLTQLRAGHPAPRTQVTCTGSYYYL